MDHHHHHFIIISFHFTTGVHRLSAFTAVGIATAAEAGPLGWGTTVVSRTSLPTMKEAGALVASPTTG